MCSTTLSKLLMSACMSAILTIFLRINICGYWSKQGIEVVSSFAGSSDFGPWLASEPRQDYEKPSGDPSNRNLAVGNELQEYRRKHNKAATR